MSKQKSNLLCSKLTKDQLLSIPNILSYVRLLLIPAIVLTYCKLSSPAITISLIILSGLTDILDGFIARKFNMVTDLGKALDPLADKLTQAAILICLISRFKIIILPITLMGVKESISFTLRLKIFNKTGVVNSAKWHGKINTIIIYSVAILHIMWYNIPVIVSHISVTVSVMMMVISFALYLIEDMIMLKNSKKS